MWYSAINDEQAKGSKEHSTALSVIGKVGEALVIAAFLAIGVDRYVKKQLVEEVARDVTPYAVAHFFPEQLKGEVQKLLQFYLIRKHYEVTVQFQPSALPSGIHDCPNHMSLHC